MVNRNKPDENRVLRLPGVIAKVGLSRATIYRLQANGQFPSSIKLGPIDRSRSATGWLESDIDTWIAERIAASRAGAAAAE